MVHHSGANAIARLVVGGILAAATVLGCATVLERSSLPVRHAVVLDQLVVHSDFRLPKQDRLFEDLRGLRETMRDTLALTPSTEPIHVYLFENEIRFKSFLAKHYPEFPARRAFFVQSENTLAVYAHWGDRVAEDLRHEVSHGYLHASYPAIPLWLDEGLAEYFETPRGDNGLNRPHVALLNSMAARGEWQPNLARLEDLSNVSAMQQVDYAESWAWVHLLLETIPQRREMVQAYLRSMPRDGIPPHLSSLVVPSFPDPNQALRDHLAALSKSQGAD